MVKLNVDKQQLARNRLALGVASISSTQIINRLKSLIDTVSCTLCGYCLLNYLISQVAM